MLAVPMEEIGNRLEVRPEPLASITTRLGGPAAANRRSASAIAAAW
jgi:hypothetical protein